MPTITPSSPTGVGLSPAEAEARLRTIGPNSLVKRERLAWAKEWLSVAADPMAVMLLAAGTVYVLLGETRDGVIMLLALIPVLGVDVVLQARSRRALKKLAQAVTPQTRVVRGGQETEVLTESLVPGDLLVLREGDVLHADGIVRWAANLTVDESSLTGEAEPQQKNVYAGPPEAVVPEDSRFYAGSLALAGHAYGEITATGARTHYGHLAQLVAEAQTAPTPLQRKMATIIRVFAMVTAVIVIAVFGLVWLQGASGYQAFLIAISLAMAGVPEEFPLVFTLFLSMGAWRLSRHGVLVRRLASVETLGSTTVICTDKTGTLTAGQFTLGTCLPWGAETSEAALLEAAVLASEPQPADTMERAILARARDHGIVPDTLYARWRLVVDYPFDSVGKHMSHVWKQTLQDGQRIWRVAAKGALEGLLEHCTFAPEEQTAIETAHANLAHQGMRILAVAQREVRTTAAHGALDDALTSGEATERASLMERELAERELQFLGFLGFRDPLRAEVSAAIAECQAAGIAVKLITGDHVLTAHAIADAAGITHTADGLLTGSDLDAIPKSQLAAQVARASIFARIRPEQKYAIVEALQQAGGIVAMTGDGINDAPALRRADIGISMGTHATEVARAAADLVLLEDNFASLVATVREGRHILGNIQRAFLYLLAFHIPILGLALIVPLVHLPLLFLPIHLVWLQMIVHPVSALSFEGEPAPLDLMRRPPRDPKAPLLPWQLALPSILTGLSLTAAVLFTYWASLGEGQVHARSAAIAVLILGSVLLIVAERAGGQPWSALPWPSTPRFWIVGGLVLFSLPVFMETPAIATALHIGTLSLQEWMVATLLATVSVGWRAFGTRWLKERVHT